MGERSERGISSPSTVVRIGSGIAPGPVVQRADDEEQLAVRGEHQACGVALREAHVEADA